jgi:hypothetical protein
MFEELVAFEKLEKVRESWEAHKKALSAEEVSHVEKGVITTDHQDPRLAQAAVAYSAFKSEDRLWDLEDDD